MTLESGRSLAQYRLAGRIGEGGMGEVWRATDSTLGRDVAIKILPGRVRRGRRAPRALRARGQGAGLAQPPEHRGDLRLPRARTASASSRWSWCPGEDLAERLKKGGVPFSEAMEIAGQIAEALEAAHDQGDRPPRPQAGEREDHARRQGQGPGLRPRQGARDLDDVGIGTRRGDVADDHVVRDGRRRDPGHRGLHEPRAGARQTRRQARRRLGVRLPRLRDALGQPSVRRRDDLRHARGGPRERPGLEQAPGDDSPARARAAAALPREGRQEAASRYSRRFGSSWGQRTVPFAPRRSRSLSPHGLGSRRSRSRDRRRGRDRRRRVGADPLRTPGRAGA